MSKYYIAYGSNLSVAQMRYRCPSARIVGWGILHDWRLVFRTYATIEPAKGYKVPVLVWSITDSDECSLDRYEGYPTGYYKQDMPVTVHSFKTGNTKDITAMVYIMTEGRYGIIPPSPVYYSTIVEGYYRFDFDRAILREALTEAILTNEAAQ